MAGKKPTTATTTVEPPLTPSFPPARVKKIVKIDKDISRISSEALYLISGASELFLQFIAEKSANIATEKKRKTIRLDDIRLAVKKHQPTREFLLDCLPVVAVDDSHPLDRGNVDRAVKMKGKGKEKVVPANTRRIDSFFKKPESLNRVEDVDEDEYDVPVNVVVDRVEDVDDVMLDRVIPNDIEDVIMDRVEDENDLIRVDEE